MYWAARNGPPIARCSLLRSSTGSKQLYLETLADRVLVALTTPHAGRGSSRLLTDDEVPAFLDEAMALFSLVAVRRGWVPPGS